jgi:hypothetical protein
MFGRVVGKSETIQKNGLLGDQSGPRKRRLPRNSCQSKESNEGWRPAGTAKRSLEGLQEASVQELSELCCRPELRNGIQFFEGGRERVGQTPDRARAKFLVLRLEVEIMHRPRKVFGSFQFAFDERLINNYFGGDIREFRSLPQLHLLSHGVKIALHPVDAYRDAIDQ